MPQLDAIPEFLLAQARAGDAAALGQLFGLAADYREVFVLRNIEYIPFNEIATRLGRSPGAARVLWTRAMQRLSQLLEEK